MELLVVCMKAVWRTDVALRLDDARRGVRGAEAVSAANPADLSALRLALELRATLSAGAAPEARARVLALTVGPPRCEEVLRGALAAGADEALRVWGRDWPAALFDAVDGSAETTRHFARAAAEALAPRRPLLALAGERSGDAGHECFGACLAQALGAAYAHRAVEAAPAGEQWRVVVKLERGYAQELHLPAPLVVTVAAQGPRPADPGLPAWLASRRASVPLWEAGAERPALPHTTLRPPLPRVKRYTVPDAGLSAEERIQAMVTQPAGSGGTLLGADAGTEAQAGAILRLLTERGYL